MPKTSHKFKAGDRIKVIANTWDSAEYNCQGHYGTVTRVNPHDSQMPYEVNIDGFGPTWPYAESELQLAEDGK